MEPTLDVFVFRFGGAYPSLTRLSIEFPAIL
jgi:hypothetical protein